MIPESRPRPTNEQLLSAADEVLVRRAVEQPGSEAARQAASELLRRYQDRVYVWCRRFTRNHDEALDLAQEVLLQAYRRLETFRSEASFSSWLFAVTRNKCLSFVRTPRLRIDVEAELEAIGDSSTDALRRIEEQQDEATLKRLIEENLEPLEQEALWLRCLEKLPVDEITRILRIETASGARGVLQSARRKLRAALAAKADERGGT